MKRIAMFIVTWGLVLLNSTIPAAHADYGRSYEHRFNTETVRLRCQVDNLSVYLRSVRLAVLRDLEQRVDSRTQVRVRVNARAAQSPGPIPYYLNSFMGESWISGDEFSGYQIVGPGVNSNSDNDIFVVPGAECSMLVRVSIIIQTSTYVGRKIQRDESTVRRDTFIRMLGSWQ